MNDKLRAAALLALDALDSNDLLRQLRAALSLRAALAEPAIKESLTVEEPEPVAFVDLGSLKFISHTPDTTIGASRYKTTFRNYPLYTAPPRREWVSLTDDDKTEIKKLVTYDQFETAGEYANRVQAATESKLKDKNGG